MGNDFNSKLSLDLVSTTAIDYLFTKSACLGRVYRESIAQGDIKQGVNKIQIPLPTAALTDSDMDNATHGLDNVNDIVIPTAEINPFQYRKKLLFKIADIESRMTRGNAVKALQLAMGASLDALSNRVDKAVTGLWTGHALQTTASATGFTDKDYITEACNLLENNNVPIERCSAIVSPNNWWNGILQDTGIVNAQNFGSNAPVQRGVIPGLYGLKEVTRSNNIIKTALSGVTTAHNIVFDEYAFAIAFVKYEPASTYGAANVEESNFEYNGVPIRVMKWFNPEDANWYLRMDISFGVGIIDANRFVHIPSKES
jgi:hypothetical protein